MIGSPITLYDNLGIYYKGGDENFPVSFCSMKAVEHLNFVKFDILGLKTVGVIQDTYKLINKDWQYADEMDWNDELVWNDMNCSNVGLFQFESKFAFDLISQFKCKTINNMSMVNASLRPSGKSYRDKLIRGEYNTNPSEEIDTLLKDNKGWLIFQEDTIKFLTDICGFSGSDADTTRRCIGHKDIKGLKEQLPKILEGYCKVSSQPREIAEKEAKEFIQIISDSSEYQFGYNHSTGYSMNGYYCAYLRYYHPLEFTTSYLNWAETEDDIKNGVELVKVKGFELKNCQFRYSIGTYKCDKETNIIYKGVGSIKYLNENCANQLYELRDNTYNDFLDLLKDITEKVSINSRQLIALIKLDYFSEFGKSKKLLDINNYYTDLYTRKQFKKSDLEQLGLTEALMDKYSGKATAKTYKEVDISSLIKELIEKIEDKDILLKDKLASEIEYLGYPITQLDVKDLYYVIKIDEFKNKRSITRYLTMYDIKKAIEVRYKLSDYMLFSESPIIVGDIVHILAESKKPKKYKDENDKWQTKKGEFNNSLDGWEIY